MCRLLRRSWRTKGYALPSFASSEGSNLIAHAGRAASLPTEALLEGQRRARLRASGAGAKSQVAAARDNVTEAWLLRDELVDPVAEGLDVLVRIGPRRDSPLIARRLGESRGVLCASPGYIRRHGAPNRPSELARHACLGYLREGRPAPFYFEGSDGGQAAVEIAGPFNANDGEVILQLALAGKGIAMLWDFLAAEHLARGALVRLLETHVTFSWPIHALYPQSRHLLPKRFGWVPGWETRLLGILHSNIMWYQKQQIVRVLEKSRRSYVPLESMLLRTENFEHYWSDEVDRLDEACQRLFVDLAPMARTGEIGSQPPNEGAALAARTFGALSRRSSAVCASRRARAHQTDCSCTPPDSEGLANERATPAQLLARVVAFQRLSWPVEREKGSETGIYKGRSITRDASFHAGCDNPDLTWRTAERRRETWRWATGGQWARYRGPPRVQ